MNQFIYKKASRKVSVERVRKVCAGFLLLNLYSNCRHQAHTTHHIYQYDSFIALFLILPILQPMNRL